MSGDARLKTGQWKAHAEYWRGFIRRTGTGCTRCGGPIDIDDRKQGPTSLVVGHITGRLSNGDDELENTQPECKACSDASGTADRIKALRNSQYTHTRAW